MNLTYCLVGYMVEISLEERKKILEKSQVAHRETYSP